MSNCTDFCDVCGSRLSWLITEDEKPQPNYWNQISYWLECEGVCPHCGITQAQPINGDLADPEFVENYKMQLASDFKAGLGDDNGC